MNEPRALKGIPSEKLNIEQEDALAREATPESLEKLLMHNVREAFFYARHFCHGKLPEEEILSAVYKALSRAVRNYKPGTKAGIRFFGYAKPYVRGGIFKEWKFKDVVKHAKHETLAGAITEDRPRNSDDEPERKDDCNLLAQLTQKLRGNFENFKYAEPSMEPEYDVIDLRERLKLVRDAMRNLTDHERMVVELVYLGHLDFRTVAEHLGVSRSAIRNTHTLALQKIRVNLGRKGKLLI
jgi:RNA polymerase sigma factor FliA